MNDGEGERTGKRFLDRLYFRIQSVSPFSLSLFSNKFAGEIPWSLQMVCFRCFILFSILFQCNTPLTLTFLSLLPIAIGRRSANGLFESFILFSLLFLTQCALDPHQFPSSSSSVAIRRQNTPPGAGRGGGREEGRRGGRGSPSMPTCSPRGRRRRRTCTCSSPTRGPGGGEGGWVARVGERRQLGGADQGLKLGGQQRPAARGACDAREAGEGCARPAIDDSPPSPYPSIPLRTRPH